MKPKVLTAVLLGSTMASVGGSAYLAGLSPPLLSHLAAPGPLVAAPAPVDAPAAVTSRPSPPSTSPPTAGLLPPSRTIPAER